MLPLRLISLITVALLLLKVFEVIFLSLDLFFNGCEWPPKRLQLQVASITISPVLMHVLILVVPRIVVQGVWILEQGQSIDITLSLKTFLGMMRGIIKK